MRSPSIPMQAFRFSGFVIALCLTALSCGDGGGLFGSSTGSVFIGESLALGQTLHGVTLDSNLTLSLNGSEIETFDRSGGPLFASVTEPSPRRGNVVVRIGFIQGSGIFDNVYAALLVTPSKGDVLHDLQDEYGDAYGITGSVAWSPSERYAVLPVSDDAGLRHGLLIVDFETGNVGRLLAADLGCYSPVPSLENARWLSDTNLELWVIPSQSHRRWDDPDRFSCQQPPPYRLVLDVAGQQLFDERLRPVVDPGTELPIDTTRNEQADGLLFVLSFNREEQSASAVPIARLTDSGFETANNVVARQEYRDTIAEQDLMLAASEGRPFGRVSLTAPSQHEYDQGMGCSWEPEWPAYPSLGASGLIRMREKALLLPTAWSSRLKPSWRPASEQERNTLSRLIDAAQLDAAYTLIDESTAHPTVIGVHTKRGRFVRVSVLVIAEAVNGTYALTFTAGQLIPGEEDGMQSAEFMDAVDLDNDGLPEIVIQESGYESWGWSILKRDTTGWMRAIEYAAAGGC